MKAIINKKVIEMTKAETKAAGIYGTVEFEELANLRKEFPTFRIVTKASKSKDNMRGLDAPYMEKYIKAHDDEERTILKEFYSLRGLDENGKKKQFAQAVSYGILRQWFLTYFPEVANMDDTIDRILAKARKKREEAAAKAA